MAEGLSEPVLSPFLSSSLGWGIDPAWLRAGVVPEAVLDAAIVLGPGSEDAHSQRHT